MKDNWILFQEQISDIIYYKTLLGTYEYISQNVNTPSNIFL